MRGVRNTTVYWVRVTTKATHRALSRAAIFFFDLLLFTASKLQFILLLGSLLALACSACVAARARRRAGTSTESNIHT